MHASFSMEVAWKGGTANHRKKTPTVVKFLSFLSLETDGFGVPSFQESSTFEKSVIVITYCSHFGCSMYWQNTIHQHYHLVFWWSTVEWYGAFDAVRIWLNSIHPYGHREGKHSYLKCFDRNHYTVQESGYHYGYVLATNQFPTLLNFSEQSTIQWYGVWDAVRIWISLQ